MFTRGSVCDRQCDLWSKLWGARSRLYRSRFLQLNTRWKALAEIYTMPSFAPFSYLKIFVKNCWLSCCFFQKFAKFARILLNFRQIETNLFGISRTTNSAFFSWPNFSRASSNSRERKETLSGSTRRFDPDSGKSWSQCSRKVKIDKTERSRK